jgi:hypothetical protein
MLAKVLGFAVSMAIVPLIVGTVGAVELAQQDGDTARLRKGMRRPTKWLAASHQPLPERQRFKRVYRVPLRIDTRESAMSLLEVGLVLREINDIWQQAGVCFDMKDTRLGPVARDELVLRFVAGGEDLPVFGAYDGSRDTWALDHPALAPAPHPGLYPAARTASHELGHVLGLPHRNGSGDSVDALMTSGRRGFLLQPEEIRGARLVAKQLSKGRGPCPAAQLLDTPGLSLHF